MSLRPNPFLLITILFWGFNFVSIKLINPAEVPAAAVLGFRYGLQWIVLVAIGLIMRWPIWPRGEHRNRILLVGLLTMGLYMSFFLIGTVRTRPADSAVILATMPVFTWLFAILFGQDSFNWGRLGSSVVAFGGVALVILGGHHAPGKGTDFLGDALIFVGGLFWSLGIVIARPALAGLRPLTFFTQTMPGALPVVAAVSIGPLLNVRWDAISPISWINLTQLVLGSGVLATATYYRGIADLGAAGATAYQFLVPIVAAGFAWLILGQSLVPIQGLGIAILIGAMLFPRRAELWQNFRARAPESAP